MRSQNEAVLARLRNEQVVLDTETINGRTKWLVRCFCGNETWRQPNNAKRSHSCGCMTKEILREARTTHGHSRANGRSPSPTFGSWKAMHDRCMPTHKSRSSYFDRGVRVCDRWNDFPAFLADMGERPEGTQLDRTDNDLGYFPGNCRWVSAKENSSNRRSNRKLFVDGELRTMSDWSRVWKIPVDTIWRRLELGWDAEDAVKRSRRWQKNLRCML
jgi:hypothetical protein